MDTQTAFGAIEWLITGHAIVSFTAICGLVKSHLNTKERVIALEAREQGRNGKLKSVQDDVKELDRKVESQGRDLTDISMNMVELVAFLKGEGKAPPKPRRRKK